MGFSISWIGFQGLTKQEVLERAGLRDTGEPDEANEADFSIAELPTGWIILFSNDVSYADVETVAELSEGCRALGCLVEEHAMASQACFYDGGQEIWFLQHNSDEGLYDLTVEGSPPDALEGIRRGLVQQQDEAGGDEADVDYLFDAPVDLAEALCGYRHDRTRFDWGEPRFTALQAV